LLELRSTGGLAEAEEDALLEQMDDLWSQMTDEERTEYEDEVDRIAAQEAIDEGGESIPWEQLKAELGLDDDPDCNSVGRRTASPTGTSRARPGVETARPHGQPSEITSGTPGPETATATVAPAPPVDRRRTWRPPDASQRQPAEDPREIVRRLREEDEGK
jgi:hypothetical protein